MSKIISAQELQSLNDFATFQVDDGYYEDGVEGFTHLIHQLSLVIMMPSPLQEEEQEQEEDDDSGIMAAVDSTHVPGTLGRDASEGERDITQFYGHPFQFEYPEELINQGEDVPARLSAFQQAATSTILQFNLALCYHLFWDEHPERTDVLLKALGLYNEAVSNISLLYSRGEIETSSSSRAPPPSLQGPVLKVLLAICVNATHCHAQMNQIRAMGYWENLSRQLLAFCDPTIHQSKEFRTLRGLFDRPVPAFAAAA